LPLLAGIDAVVNCVGVLQDGLHDDAHVVHVAATVALFDACVAAGIRRVVHISAIGADAAGPTAFARTKAAADAHLAALDLDWMILRPALVLAPAAYGGSALLRALAAFPLLTPLPAGASRIQVVSVDDVAATVALCLAPAAPGAGAAPARSTWELAHPQAHALGEIVAALRRWLGYRPVPAVTVPPAIAAAVAGIADALGRLGWRSPLRSTALAQLGAGVVGDPSAWMRSTGIRPQSLDDILAAQPAGVQERWFARLYLIKPVAIAALALFWVATGVLALGPGRTAAMAHLTQAGLSPPLARLTVDLGALFDIVLGVLLCVRRFARPVLLVMLAVTPLYILAGTMLAPRLWIDPLGPLTKIVPLLIATLFVLAIIDER
jgi:uncharacterized protein YbjT (DUF2867 family)